MSKKVYLEVKLPEQLEEIYWELENCKNQMVFLKRSSELEDSSELSSLYQDGINQGRFNILEALEEKLESAKGELWKVIERERGEDEK